MKGFTFDRRSLLAPVHLDTWTIPRNLTIFELIIHNIVEFLATFKRGEVFIIVLVIGIVVQDCFDEHLARFARFSRARFARLLARR